MDVSARHVDILADFESHDGRYAISDSLAKQAQHVIASEDIGEGASKITLSFLDPNKLVFAMLQFNSELRSEFAACLRKYSPPWHIVWGADECFSGNALHESGRKVLAMSYSFLELEQQRLSKMLFWFTACVIRSKVANRLPGGHSQIFRILLRRQLLSKENGLAGPGLALPELNTTLRGLFEVLLCDGDGWKNIVQSLAASSLRPCPRCLNVWSVGSDMAGRHRHEHVELDCTVFGKFDQHTPASLKRIIEDAKLAEERVKRRRMNKGDLKDLIKYHGYRPTAEGVWSDSELVDLLRFPQTIALDWPHNILQDGVLAPELSSYCASLSEAKMGELRDFISEWRPSTTVERRAFTQLEVLLENGGVVVGHSRPTALDFLIIVAVMRCYLHVSEDATPHGRSLRLLCGLVSSIQRAKWAKTGCAEKKQDICRCWEAWFSAHQDVHGPAHIKPKSHWLGHTWEQNGFILDSFVIERLHRRSKAIARPIVSTRGFEKTVGSLLLNVMLRQHLVPGVQLHPADEHGFAKGISVDGLTFASGNFVAHSGMVGQVLFCRMVGEDGWLVVRLCGRPSTRDMERKTTEWCMAVTLRPSSVAEWEVTACDRALGSKQFGDNFLVLSQP